MKKMLAGLLISTALAGIVGAQTPPTAYRILGNSIRVDRASLWQNWESQNDRVTSLYRPLAGVDVIRVSEEGVQPTFFRRKTNAALEADKFTYPDVVRAAGALVNGGAVGLSNTAEAHLVIDDDLSTYWEPAAPASYEARLRDPKDFSVDNLRNWELTVDLGRLVYADSITVIFPSGRNAEAFLGHPGKAFVLWASMGERFPFPLGNNLKFTPIGQATTPDEAAGKLASPQQGTTGTVQAEGGKGVLEPVPGTEGRYLQSTFYLTPLDRADFDLDGLPDISGSPVQYVKLTITGSGLWRKTFIGAGDSARVVYESLSSVQRGALVYQRQTAGGFLVEIEDDPKGLTARERYLSLPPEKQGPILYYTREVPRVAEIQVWSRGDNYALRPEQRAGASFENGGLGAPQNATDGVYDSEWQANTWSPIYTKGTAWWDLGAVFWVDNLFLIDKRIQQSNNGAFLGHFVLVSDGTLLKPITMQGPDDFPQLENGLEWDNVVSEAHSGDNRTTQVRIVNEQFPLRKIRYVMLRDIDITGSLSGQYGSLATLGELQLYGEGYPVSVWAYSPPISLTDSKGNFIRKTLPRISWEGEAIVRQTDLVTGRTVEVAEALENHPEVRLQIQTRTSDQTDSTFKYFEVVSIEGNEERSEITKELYDDLVFRWNVWNTWTGLKTPHASNADDDKDGSVDEDEIDFVDNDGDGKIDEDGKKLGNGRKPKSNPAKEGVLAFVGWSGWSESYLPTDGRNEALITSPNPRKFLQIRVNLLSDDPLRTARIRSLRVDLAPPLSLELAGEVARLNTGGTDRLLSDLPGVVQADYTQPIDVDPLQPQIFSYFIRAAGPDPADSEVRQGFDELLVTTPRAATLRGVRLGQVKVVTTASPLDPTAVLTGAVTTTFSGYFQRDPADGTFKDAAGQVLQVLPAGTDSLYLRLPASLNAGLSGNTQALAEIQFQTQTLKEGEEFGSYIRSSSSTDAIFQRVNTDQQDATELVASSTARISLMPLADQLVHNVTLDRVFTPNGDGINDQARVSFTLLKVLAERPVAVNFYDLQGRLAGSAQATSGANAAGEGKVGTLEFRWDGRGAKGQPVPPGIYLCRISVDADQGKSEQVHLVHVVY